MGRLRQILYDILTDILLSIDFNIVQYTSEIAMYLHF